MSFYKTLATERKHTKKLQSTVTETVAKLLTTQTNSDHPGVLLGRIQSGKTGAFIGVIAEAFDKGIDVVIVLTKNSELLGTQTTRRIKQEFKTFEDDNLINIHYIHNFGDTRLQKSQMLNKKVFIAIKNPSSVEKLFISFKKYNPTLCSKNILIIDDEADTGAIGTKGSKDEKDLLETGKKLDKFRKELKHAYFLQVTATPYSLYLQPNDIITPKGIYKPIRPQFTQILDAYDGYVGGKTYFEDSEDIDNPAYHIKIQATPDDIETLKSKKQDVRIERNVSKTPKLTAFRKAIDNFLVSVAVRRVQEKMERSKQSEVQFHSYQLGRYAFIFHLDTSKNKMVWQETLIRNYLNYLLNEWIDSRTSITLKLKQYFENDFLPSLEKAKKLNWINYIPKWTEVEFILNQIFELEDYQIFVINSDKRVIDLADDNGQLKLETALNFFVGGQVLDRGITIENLIGFFYGRDPKISQMDTVLQHARMYGNRKLADLAVTRMYTTDGIYNRMKEIHQIDEALRKALINNDRHEIVLLQASKDGTIKPASANRINLGNIKTLVSYKTKYPYGFETKGQTECTKITTKIDSYLKSISGYTDKIRTSFKISFNDFEHIIKSIDSGILNYDLGVKLDLIEWVTIMRKMLEETKSDFIYCYVQTGRKLGRFQKNGEPMDAPYTGGNSEKRYAEELINTVNAPVLILLRQEGKKVNDWKDAPFYWPVIVNPLFERPLIFEWS